MSPLVRVQAIIFDAGVAGRESVLSIDIERVVYLPIDVTDLPCRMVEPLQDIEKHPARTKTNHTPLHRLHHSVDHMRRLFEDIWPEMVEEMCQAILTAKSHNPQGEMFHRLSMNDIPINESIFQERDDCGDVIFRHLADVFKHEAQSLQNAILDIHIGDAVLIHESWEDSEGRTEQVSATIAIATVVHTLICL
jgi:hypothetical protein